MSKSNQMSRKQIMTVIAIAIVLIVLSVIYQFGQPINAQNMTGNQPGNQTGGLNLVPPRVIEEETQEEILGGQQ